MNNKNIKKRGKYYYAEWGLWGLLLTLPILEIVALILWVPGSWNERLTAVLIIVGIYGLAIALFRNTPTMKSFVEDLTSPNIIEFVVGNCRFLTFLLLLVAAGCNPEKKPGYPLALWFIGNILSIFSVVIVLVYAIFHMLIVAVITYIPTVIASAIVSQIVYAGRDYEIKIQYKNGPTESTRVCDVVRNNEIAAKGFLVGLPAILISLLSAISTPFFA